MNQGKYVFSQITDFIPKRQFERLAAEYNDRTKGWELTPWNQLLVLIYGQLEGCRSLRELTGLTTAHGSKSFHLGFGRLPVNKSTLSKANQLRDCRLFERFAYYMVNLAQDSRIDREFVLHGKYYAFDSSTISLCLKLFDWAKFRSTRSGIKMHTQYDIVTDIPVAFNITNAEVHDVNVMDEIEYEPRACYIFDKGYWDLGRLFRINLLNSFFVIREKSRPKYEVIAGEDTLEGPDNVLRDQTVRFTTKGNHAHYPSEIRRIVYYAPELKRTFTYYTNNFILGAGDIALLYKYRWKVETFFKWIKQHLQVKKFWGNSENAVRIQIYTAIITYCTVAIIEKTINLNRSVYEVLRILSGSLLAKDCIADLFLPTMEPIPIMNGQLQLEF